jgi:hypothetical protein
MSKISEIFTIAWDNQLVKPTKQSIIDYLENDVFIRYHIYKSVLQEKEKDDITYVLGCYNLKHNTNYELSEEDMNEILEDYEDIAGVTYSYLEDMIINYIKENKL